MRIVRLPSWTLPESRLNVSFDLSFATRPGAARTVAALLDEFKPDVIHQHGQFMDLTWATGAYARRRDMPALLSIHTRLENPVAHYRHAFRGLDAVLVAPRSRYQPAMVVMDSYMQEYIEEPLPRRATASWSRSRSASTPRGCAAGRAPGPRMLGLGRRRPGHPLRRARDPPARPDRPGRGDAAPCWTGTRTPCSPSSAGSTTSLPAPRRGARRRARRPKTWAPCPSLTSRTCWPPPTSRATSRAGASAPPPWSRWPPACGGRRGVECDNFPERASRRRPGHRARPPG